MMLQVLLGQHIVYAIADISTFHSIRHSFLFVSVVASILNIAVDCFNMAYITFFCTIDSLMIE